MAKKPEGRTVVAAVERDLARLKKLDADLAESTLAMAALQLAFQLDEPGNSATSKAMCSKALIEAMDRLRDLAPEKQEGDGIDDLESRRAARLARSAGAAG